MNLLEFPAGLGEFDYIIAHGFYSWVPDFVRRKMWEVLAAHLSANGVAGGGGGLGRLEKRVAV